MSTNVFSRDTSEGCRTGEFFKGGAVWLALVALLCAPAFAQTIQLREDFSTDPGWQGINNRVIASDPPLVRQDFGWVRPDNSQNRPGQIGGTVFQSRTPAWYAMPIGRPLTLNDSLSASGTISISVPEDQTLKGAAYIGFFNSQRQGWRPWNSMALRVTRDSSQGVTIGIDTMSSTWNGYGIETDIQIPADGRPHTWKITYDPDANPPPKWKDVLLQACMTSSRQTLEEIFAKAKQSDPDTSLEQVKSRLHNALSKGLIEYFPRDKGAYYTLAENLQDRKGLIQFQIDNGPVYHDWLPKWLRNAPASFDRFGIFNLQLYHRVIQFFVSDLAVNGRKINLDQDPQWEGRGNRAQYFEEDFQRQNFGYSQTNWAGNGVGEIGGEFCRSEPNDPLYGYYAVGIGQLSLDSPINFSGSICFVEGATDSSVFFGYFNSGDYLRELPADMVGVPSRNMMGIVVEGRTRDGFRFGAWCSPASQIGLRQFGPLFMPDAKRHRFSFSYDPNANRKLGKITVALDSKRFEVNLTPAQRSAGAVMDRFGLASMRKGGKCAILYLDDLTYTVSAAAIDNRERHPQRLTIVPYPPEGRGVW